MAPISLLIVDDSAIIRHMLTEILSGEPTIRIVGTACDPLDAREKIKQLNPDVITLDIEMPKMDGLTFLEKIMTLRPMPVIMVSTLTQKGGEATLRALDIGAVDCIEKPVNRHNSESLSAFREELISKIQTAAKAKVSGRTSASLKPAIIDKQKVTHTVFTHPKDAIIGIGSSTGGVQALAELLATLPGNLPPIVIVQHIQDSFVAPFANRLNNSCQMTVCEVAEDMQAKSGHVYIATGGKHLKVMKEGGKYMLRIISGDPVGNHRPAISVLFHSLANAAGANAVGVMLTGMGKDGADGMLAMREAGAHTIGQDEVTCIVYGMPKAAKMLGAVCKELPLQQIGAELVEYFTK